MQFFSFHTYVKIKIVFLLLLTRFSAIFCSEHIFLKIIYALIGIY